MAAPAVVVWIVIASSGRDEEAPRRAEGRAAVVEDRIARAELERLSDEVRRLSQDLGDARAETRSLKTAFRQLLRRGSSAGGEGGGPDPQSLFDQYVYSFAEGGQGSEYFRLGVDAYAPELLEEILAKLRDTGAPVSLRLRLLKMLANARFKGDSEVIDALLEVGTRDPNSKLSAAALKGLVKVGDANTGLAVERSLGIMQEPWRRQSAVRVVVQLAGADGNKALARMFRGERDAGGRQKMVYMLRTNDAVSALDTLRHASSAEQPVRLAAAKKLGQFRDADARTFARQWHGVERDAAVKRILANAIERQTKVPSWDAMKATGKPDAKDPARDSVNAWASKAASGGAEWLLLTYAQAFRASKVRIYEVLSAGAVVRVETVDTGGVRRAVWQGGDPTAAPGVFEVSFPLTAYRVKQVRVVLDTRRGSGWNEIDAVELVGPDARAWAVHAVASTTYGQ